MQMLISCVVVQGVSGNNGREEKQRDPLWQKNTEE